MTTYDPFNTLADAFTYNLATYGTMITVGDKQIKALFKLEKDNTGKNQSQYLVMFTDYQEAIPQGQEFIMQGKHYLTLKDNSDENTVYNKTKCLDCNQFIKYELRQPNDAEVADLTEFYAYGEDITAVNSSNGGLITIQSTCHFMFPLNDLTRRIRINDRFYAGQSQSGVWKVRDLNYQDGICDVYCIRDATKENDDPETMIADRWLFEHIPDMYVITLSPKAINIKEGQTQTISVAVTKNDEPMEKAPELTYIIGDPTVASIDPETNILTGLKVGKVNITAEYKASSNDRCTCNTIVAEVTEEPAHTYEVILSPNTVKLHPDETKALQVIVTKDNKPIEPTPKIKYTVSPSGFATIDNNTNTITATNIGECTITGRYETIGKDISLPDEVKVNVVKMPVVSDTYKVTLSPKEINLTPNKTQQLKIAVIKNEDIDVVPTPEIEFTVSPSGIAKVNNKGLVTALKDGTCTITGSYKAKPEDVAISDSVTVHVKANVEPKIYVDPPMESSGYYPVHETWGESVFNCVAEGIDNPKWEIKLQNNSINPQCYKCSIDEEHGKFIVECLNFPGSNNCTLRFNIVELTIGKAIRYTIKLKSMF